MSDPVFKSTYPFAIRLSQSFAHKLGFGPETDMLDVDPRRPLDGYQIYGPPKHWGPDDVPHCKWINVNYHALNHQICI